MPFPKVDKSNIQRLKGISKWIILITSIYTLLLSIYPSLSNLLFILGIILLILGVLEVYKSGWSAILKPGILTSSLGLILLYSFIIYIITNSSVFQNMAIVVSWTVIGLVLSIITFISELF